MESNVEKTMIQESNSNTPISMRPTAQTFAEELGANELGKKLKKKGNLKIASVAKCRTVRF